MRDKFRKLISEKRLELGGVFRPVFVQMQSLRIVQQEDVGDERLLEGHRGQRSADRLKASR
jgi:hypothetical protein